MKLMERKKMQIASILRQRKNTIHAVIRLSVSLAYKKEIKKMQSNKVQHVYTGEKLECVFSTTNCVIG